MTGNLLTVALALWTIGYGIALFPIQPEAPGYWADVFFGWCVLAAPLTVFAGLLLLSSAASSSAANLTEMRAREQARLARVESSGSPYRSPSE